MNYFFERIRLYSQRMSFISAPRPYKLGLKHTQEVNQTQIPINSEVKQSRKPNSDTTAHKNNGKSDDAKFGSETNTHKTYGKPHKEIKLESKYTKPKVKPTE